MHADLEFEYPHKIEKMIIKGKMLSVIEEEEKRITQMEYEKEASAFRRKIVSYEEFYDNMKKIPIEMEKVNVDDEAVEKKKSQSDGASNKNVSYDDFKKDHASNYLFDQDLNELRYKFWENDEERYERLKKVWMQLKKTHALGGVDARTPVEQIVFQSQLVENIRNLRWRIDQELVKKGEYPIFKDYYSSYSKKEFLIDSDIDFFKLQKFLKLNPKTLEEDPQIGYDYTRILNLIKKKKLLEETRPVFGNDVEVSYHHEITQKPQSLENFNKQKTERERELQELHELDDNEPDKDDFDGDDELENTKTIGILKKEKSRDKDRFLKHFEDMTKKMEEGTTYYPEKKKEKKNEKRLKTKLKMKERKELAKAQKPQ